MKDKKKEDQSQLEEAKRQKDKFLESIREFTERLNIMEKEIKKFKRDNREENKNNMIIINYLIDKKIIKFFI